MAKSDAETRRELAQLRTLISQGKTDFEILNAMNCLPTTLHKLKQRLYSDELDVVQNETAAENWVRYHLRMEQALNDLDAVIEDAAGNENATALNARVGAIKAKVDIIDRDFDRGQELGVIPTVAKQQDSEYPTEIPSLRALVEEKTKLMAQMAKQYGSMDYADLDDIPEEDLYFDDKPSNKSRAH